MAMNVVVKQRWLQDLRSGNFPQGKKSLRQETVYGILYCCLGVLCERHRQEAHTGSWRNKVYAFPDRSGSDVFLPYEVRDWAGLDEADPMVSIEGELRSLSDLNDNGYTFEKIADLIEAQL